MTITGQSSLNKDDIERMVRDAESHAEDDRRRREEAEVRNQADTLVYSTEKILKDQIITLKHHTPKHLYPEKLRLVVALVEVDGKERSMTFLSNNLDWSAQSVADLYRCRWNIEVFFKTLKQTLQLADFLGYSANAVRWQIWMALLTELLLRFIAWQSPRDRFGGVIG